MNHRSFIKSIACLVFILFMSSFEYASAQSTVTAIDDQTMQDSAKVYNAIMCKNYSGPGSFALDAMHHPHVSVLQCFVKTTELEKVFAAVATVVKSENPTKEKLTTKGFYYIADKGLGLAGITTDTTSGLMRFQRKLIEAVKPYFVQGTDASFVQNANGAPIAAGTAQYVNEFVPAHSGANYNPHVTIGLAKESFLKELVAKPYNKFVFKISAVSIYHLGDYGTAQKKLWTSSKNE
jgi:hypothetical protein